MGLKLLIDLFLDKLKLTSYHRRRRKYNIGEHSYINHTTKMGSVKMGKFCSVANDVIMGIGNHPMDYLTTSPFIYSRNKVKSIGNILVDEKSLIKSNPNHKSNSATIIENDVWIGERAIILLGVKVGNGAVIGAGAVVTKDVPPYAIVAGVPAKVIRYRFPDDIIAKLQELKWWDYPDDFIVKLPFDNIDECIKILEENKNLKNN